jgi:cell division septal protein FtsQ
MNRRRIYSYQGGQESSRKIFLAKRKQGFSSQRRVRHYAEPVFAKKKNTLLSKKKSHSTLLKGILIAGSVLATLGFFIYIPYFRIKKITLQGFKTTSKSEVESFVSTIIDNEQLFFPKNNIFLVDSKKIEKDILDKFSFAEVHLKKSFPNSIEIEVEEKESVAIAYSNQDYFLIDRDGRIIQKMLQVINNSGSSQSNSSTTKGEALKIASISYELPTIDISAKPNINNVEKDYQKLPLIYFSSKVTEGQQSDLTSKEIQAIKKWKQYLEENKMLKLAYFAFKNRESGVEIFSDKPFKIQANLDEQVMEQQFKSLDAIIKNFNPKEYIDVRYDGRVYYK